MQTARRLYLYAMSGITLGVLLVGLSTLLRVLFEQAGLHAGIGPDSFFDRDAMLRQDLATAGAMIGVGLPVWAIHWFIVQRSLRGSHGDFERGAPLRALYLALVLAILGLVAAAAAIELIGGLILPLAGGDDRSRDVAAPLAALLASSVGWSYHLAVRMADTRRGELTGPAAWLPRTYLYVAAFAGAMLAMSSAGEIVRIAIERVLGTASVPPSPIGVPEPSGVDARALSDAIAALVVGAVIWLGHWWYAQRLRADPGWRGRSERLARLRLAYYVALVAVSAVAVIFFGAEGVRAVLVHPLGAAARAADTATVASSILLPLASALPFALAWWLHRDWLRLESATIGSDRVATADRLNLYAVALVGLAFAAAGVAWLLGLGLDAALGGERATGVTVRGELAQAIPVAVLGLVAWLSKWRRIVARHRRDPGEEAAATSRRAYLFLVLAAAIVAGLGGLGTLLYRAFGELVGIGSPDNLVSEISVQLGVLLTAVVIGAFHGALLRRDGARVTPSPTAVPEWSPHAAAADLQPPGRAVAWLRRPVVFSGESAGLRLHAPGSNSLRAAASWWRIDYSEVGSGEALFVWLAQEVGGDWTGPVVFTDAPPVAHHVAERLARHLPEFADLHLDDAEAHPAVLDRQADLASRLRVEATVGEHRVVVAWREPLDRRLVHWPAFALGPERLDLTTVMVPCAAADLVVDGVRVDGEVAPGSGDERSQSSAYIAAAQTWTEPQLRERS